MHLGGVRNVIDALGASPAHVVLVTQIYVTNPEGHPDMERIIRARAASEDLLRSSGLAYTIVRPSWLTDAAGTTGIELRQDDARDGSVGRDAVAAIIAASFSNASARQKSFEVYQGGGSDQADWARAFAGLVQD